VANRTNHCPNPALANNSTGWFNGSRVTGLPGTMQRTTGYSFGPSDGIAPQGNVNANQAYTYSCYFLPNSNGVVQWQINWYSGGSYYSSSSGSSGSVVSGTVYRLSTTATAPSGTDSALLLVTGVDGYMTSVLYEQASTLGTYFDGSSVGGSWLGSSGNSESTIPVNTLQTVSPTGIPSGTAFGTTVVTRIPGPTLTPTGIPSATAFGVATVTPGAVTVNVAGQGIPSAEAFGNPTQLPGFLMVPSGIPSREAFGSHTVTPGPVTVSPLGITSLESFGDFIVTKIQVAIPSVLFTKPSTTIQYEMTVVRRIMQQSGPPQYSEIDALSFTGLSYTETVSKPEILAVGANISSVSPAIVSLLDDMAHKQCEIYVYRNGVRVFSGPWAAFQVHGESLTINAKGPLAYLDRMGVLTDVVFAQVDQFQIAKSLIDIFQNLEYSNYGIDTSAVGVSGVLRDATYLLKEGNYVGKLLQDLGKRLNGFDFSVDPITRKLQLYYPYRGVDRSTGEGALIFDKRNVNNTNIICTIGTNDVATEGIAIGTSSGSTDGSVVGIKSNTELRSQFGRSVLFQSYNGVSEQPTIDAYAQSIIDARQSALLIPGPDSQVTPDSDLTLYDVGDTVQYQLHQLLNIRGKYRINSRQVTVQGNGKEKVTVGFV
jgi:hypothetical protein